jgi:hypothetical protein
MSLFYSYLNWRALENLPAIQPIYPVSILFGLWLLLKTIGWLTNKLKSK